MPIKNAVSPWNSPEKVKARERTIINPYRHCSGRTSIPLGSQYITLSGLMVDSSGDLDPLCEFRQVTEQGLIQPEQFVGIDNDEHPRFPNVVAQNHSAFVRLFPTNPPTMIKGDFNKVLEGMMRAENLRPSIINLDLMIAPLAGQLLLSPTLHLLNLLTGPMLLIWNVKVADHYRGGRSGELDLRYGLRDGSPSLRRAIREGRWQQVRYGEEDYEYRGLGHKTIMRSVLFWRDQ